MAIDNPLDAYEAQHLKDEPMLPNKLARYATDFGIKLALPGGGLAVEILIGVLDKLCDRESGIERVKEGSFDYAQDDNSRNPYRSHPFAKNAKWWGSLGGGILSPTLSQRTRNGGAASVGEILSPTLSPRTRNGGAASVGEILSPTLSPRTRNGGAASVGKYCLPPFRKEREMVGQPRWLWLRLFKGGRPAESLVASRMLLQEDGDAVPRRVSHGEIEFAIAIEVAIGEPEGVTSCGSIAMREEGTGGGSCEQGDAIGT